MKNLFKVFFIFSALCIIPQITFAQIVSGLAEGWYIRDRQVKIITISYVKEYIEMNDTISENAINYSDDVIIFRSINPPDPDHPLVGMYAGKYTTTDLEKLYIILGKTWYEYIKNRDNYFWEPYEFPSATGERHGADENWWPTSKAQFSAFHSFFKIEKNWGFDESIGLDQINYPWWYAGVFRAGFIHQKVRFGIQGPVRMGYPTSGFLGSTRLLDAGWGGYLSFNVDGFNGELFYSDYLNKANEVLRSPNEIYFLIFGGMMGYSFYANMSDFMSDAALKISVGGEMHQIGQGHVKNETEIVKDKTSSTEGPYLRFDLTRYGDASCNNDIYEIFVQFANYSIMLGGGWNITKVLGIEARVVPFAPLRDLKPWEHSSMFMISPRIRFDF